MESITSRTNPLITRIRKLTGDRKYRRREGVMVCEGPKMLAEALRWGAGLETILWQTGTHPPAGIPQGVRQVEVPGDLLRSVAPTETPQQVLFLARLPARALPEELTGSRYLVLDGLQDPGNLGTLWRTADAFGADGLLLLPGCADPWSPKTLRATMGACFRLPVWEGTLEDLTGSNPDTVIMQVQNIFQEIKSYTNIGKGTVSLSETEDKDWVNNWKKYFHQFYVDDILIIPFWEEVKPEDEGKMIVHIDPGTAFGTGMHETTQLCIRQLRKYVTENTRILDVGCGSGILGMLALMFGAKYSVGTDLDPCAIDATYENMEVNGISKDKYEVMIGNIIDDKAVQDKVGYGCYDIVVANILADVLVPLTPVIVNQLKDGGIYVTSGIIEDKEETVKAAVEAAGLTVLEVHHQGEWVSVTARKETKA